MGRKDLLRHVLQANLAARRERAASSIYRYSALAAHYPVVTAAQVWQSPGE